MTSLSVHVRSAASWREVDGVSVRGTAFVGDTLLGAGDIAARLAKAVARAGFDGFVAAVASLNGHFAAIARPATSELFAAVDAVRSRPLFYSIPQPNKTSFMVSDDAIWLRDRLGDRPPPPELAAEFLLAGYVTGDDTLHPDIKQLRPGEALAIRCNAGAPVEMVSRRYYSFFPAPDAGSGDAATLSKRLADAMRGACMRLTAYAAGRQIALPLSGGYDSRVIALTLKQLSYDNLVAFTYGRAGNVEARISESVAKALGIAWHFVAYDNATWAAWYASDVRSRYFSLSHQLVSVPHIQDCPAVGALRNAGVIDEDAVIAPGHSGDFTAGSHIPGLFVGAKRVDSDLFLRHMYARHFRLWSSREHPRDVLAAMEARVIARVKDGLGDPDKSISCHDQWDFEERQAKFIVNSVRVYEMNGCDWWLPLFDRSLLDFWCRVPLDLRVGQHLYNDYVTRAFASMTGVDATVAAQSDKRTFGMALRRMVRRVPLLVPPARYVFDHVKKRRIYDSHPLAMFGIVDRGEFARLYTGRETVNSFIARDILGVS